MMRYQTVFIAILITVLLAIVGLRAWMINRPLHLNLNGPAGKVYNSVTQCAENQRDVYLLFEDHIRTYNEPPVDIDELDNKSNMTHRTFVCSEAGEHEAGRFAYTLYPENYGKPAAVFIEDNGNAHPSTFSLWFRGFSPQVCTMGDGTIQLFEDGKVATMSVH